MPANQLAGNLPAFHYFLKKLSTLQSPDPFSRKASETNKYINASSCLLNGSAPCTPINATSIVQAMKKLDSRVKNPTASSIPPKNSASPAAHAKNTGTGNPNSPVRLINPSDGGNFPKPWPRANATPANIRSSANPAFAAYDSPDSPPKSIDFINDLFLPLLVYFVVKEWHNFRSKTTGLETCEAFASY